MLPTWLAWLAVLVDPVGDSAADSTVHHGQAASAQLALQTESQTLLSCSYRKVSADVLAVPIKQHSPIPDSAKPGYTHPYIMSFYLHWDFQFTFINFSLISIA